MRSRPQIHLFKIFPTKQIVAFALFQLLSTYEINIKFIGTLIMLVVNIKCQEKNKIGNIVVYFKFDGQNFAECKNLHFYVLFSIFMIYYSVSFVIPIMYLY